MFDTRGAPPAPAGAAGRCAADRSGAPACPADLTGVGGVGPVDPVDVVGTVDLDGAGARESVERLAAMAPGGALAEVVERVMSHLLAPTAPRPQDPGERSGATGADPALGVEAFGGGPCAPGPDGWVQSIFDPVRAAAPDDGLFQAMAGGTPNPGERALLEAAGAARVAGGGAAAGALVGLGAGALVELVAACERLSSWAQWAGALAAACLARCPEMAGRPAPPGREAARLAAPDETRLAASSEIALRLGVSRTRATRVLEHGEALLDAALAPTGDLQRVGLIDRAKADVVARRLEGVDPRTALRVQARVLPQAAHRPHARLARELDRALTALDPDGTGARRRRNTASRRVSRPRPAGEGVSEMRLLMPTMDAFLLDATLDAVAACARAGGDERTAPQLRCDALTGMCLDTLRRSQRLAVRTGRGSKQTPTPPAGGAQDPGAEHRTDRAERRAEGAEGAERASGAPGTDRPPGPEATGPGRLLPDGVPLEGLLTELSHLVGSTSPWWTPSGTDPVHPAPGLSVTIDVTVPLDRLIGAVPAAPPGAAPPPSAPPPGSAPPSDPPPEPGPFGDAPPVPGETATATVGGRTAPVPDAVARALAAGGTWRRLVTDPLSGAVIDVGRTRYRPPAALADLVRARDGACTHPGCAVPARRCDLDHITPWSGGGTTGLDNLTALCRTHHRLKHAPGWTLTRTPDGDLTWTTPTGARYRRNRDATITALPRRVGPHHITLPAAPVPDHLARALTDTIIARLEHGLNHYADDAPAPAPATGPGRPPAPARPVLTTRGPAPATAPGAYETTPYPAALHALDLATILDAIPPY